MIGELPKYVTIGKRKYKIRYQVKACLDILIAFNDPDLRDEEKIQVALTIFYPDIGRINMHYIQEAYEKMVWFLNMGGRITEDNARNIRLYDWQQDEQMIFSAVNKVAGYETREKKDLHFWTFISYFYEIGDGTFSYVVRIRDKQNRHEKLDDGEKRFLKENKNMVKLETRKSEKEKNIIDKINKLLD